MDKKKGKTKAKDLPGSGMARKAGDAIEARRKMTEKRIKEIFGK